MQEMQVPSLGQEEPLEEEMAIHSCILAWEVPWMEEPGELQSMGSHNWATEQNQQKLFHTCVSIAWTVDIIISCVLTQESCVWLLTEDSVTKQQW